MTSSSTGPDRMSQRATASGQARVNQAGRDQYNYTTVWGPGSGTASQALAALPAAVNVVGRAERTDELLKVLDPSRSGPNTVVVTGLAGIGKTALALHAAHHAVARNWFPSGTLFVHLRGYDPAGPVSGDQALEALLRALGIRDDDLPPTAGERENLYRSELSRRAQDGPVLIVADDASNISQLRPLAPGHPEHRLLCTSRDSLTGPDFPARLIGLEPLEAEPAAALIVGALTRARPEDSRPDHEPQALLEIAEFCGYLPLALTIATAQLTADPGLPLTTLANDLICAGTRLAALRYPARKGHSLGIQAAFDLCYRRLDDPSADLFRLLSLNPGPDVSTRTAAALAHQPERRTRQSLAALAQAGLINEQPMGSGRWRMHDLTRLYADEQCRRHDSAPFRQQALGYLCEYYRATTAAADDHLQVGPRDSGPDGFPDRAAALAWLESERLNLTATVALTAGIGYYEVTMSLATRLGAYLHQRRYFHDVLTTSQYALSAARELGDRQGEGRALNNLGVALREMRRFEEAIDAHTQGLAVRRESGDRHSEGGALNNLGAVLREMRQFEAAIDAHTQAADIYREFGDRHSEGGALNNLGVALRRVGRFEEAIDAHTQAADIYCEFGDRHSEGGALNNLGLALGSVGRFEEAVEAHTRDLVTCRESGDRHSEGGALNNLGLVLMALGRFEEAIDAYTQAADIFRESGDRHSEGGALNNLGLALRRVGRFEEAVEAHTRDLATCRESGYQHNEGRALNNLGLALQEVGRYEEAIDAYSQAAEFFREFGDRHSESVAVNNLDLAQAEISDSHGPQALWRKITRRR